MYSKSGTHDHVGKIVLLIFREEKNIANFFDLINQEIQQTELIS